MAFDTLNYMTDSGDTWEVGGTLNLKDGAVILNKNGDNIADDLANLGGGGGFLGVQVITATGDYTPHPDMAYCVVELLGGGAAGGGLAATSPTERGVAPGGGAGERVRAVFTAAAIGESKTVTIGAGGAGASAGAGANGGTTSLGALLTALGGVGGALGTKSAEGAAFTGKGGLGGSGGSASGQVANSLVRVPGANGGYMFQMAVTFATVATSTSGEGANSIYGAGGITQEYPGGNGNNASGYGAGGSGAMSIESAAARLGGNGSPGIAIITEYK